MKKRTAFLLALTAALSLTACGSKQEAAATKAETSKEAQTTVAEAPAAAGEEKKESGADGDLSALIEAAKAE